jgi:hypothetical protein
MRGYTKTTIKNPQAALRLGWHDFSLSRGCVPLPNLLVRRMRKLWAGFTKSRPFPFVRLRLLGRLLINAQIAAPAIITPTLHFQKNTLNLSPCPAPSPVLAFPA